MKNTLTLLFLLSCTCLAAQTTILPFKAVWKYLDDGTDGGTAWRASNFNDGSWASGPAQLGYGDGDEATVVSYGPRKNKKYITTYFRTSVTITDPAQYSAYSFSVNRDDGVVVYLNGSEIYRDNLPTGTITYTTPASGNAPDDGATPQVFSAPASAFTAGTNVIAVEIHQVRGSSPDISFDLQLTGTAAPPACGVPSGLAATNITASSATLGWTAVNGATGYTVQYRQTGTTTWTTATTTATSVGVSALTAATQYEFQVRTQCSASSSAFSASATFTTQAQPSSIPRPDHVVVLILENRAYASIIGLSAAPFINALAKDPYSALFTQSYGNTHPSQPNYLHLYSGSNQGVTDNNVPANNPFTTPNLGRELIDKGLWFATYSQGLPSVGYNGATSGAYVRKHNPVTNWMGSGTNQVPATTNQPFTAFPTDFTTLPAVSFVVPDLNNDMHDGSITTGDTWTYNNLNTYIQWAKTHNSLFILTFDEDDGSAGNHIVTIFTGQRVAAGQYSNTINHHNVLRTIEDMYGLSHAGSAATATPITNCWTTTPAVTSVSPSSTLPEAGERKITVYPNPVQSWVNFNFSQLPETKVVARILDMTGRLVGQYELSPSQHAQVNVSALPGGTYSYELLQNNRRLQSGLFSKKER